MKQSSLKSKIWIYFSIFSVIILACLWFFQIAFLDTYYEYQKKFQLNRIASKVEKAYSGDNFEDVLDEIAYKNDVCIEITASNGDDYFTGMTSKGCFINSNFNYKRDFINSGDKTKKYELVNGKFNNKTLIYSIKLDNNLYAFINVSLEPVSNTTKILANQFIFVTLVVLILAFIIAYFVSSNISKPIVRLKRSATRMSKGCYDVVFDTNSNITEIDELAATLNSACIELSKTEELRREFLANVSHDLKTPLTMIKAYAEMIRDLTYEDKEKSVKNLNVIIDETERLNLLVGDLLELSKIQANVEVLNKEEFDLNDMIKTIVGRFKYLEETEGYEFIYNNDKSLMTVGDSKKIEQVIYNLISNAVNYVGKDKKVTISIKEVKSGYRVEVINYGNIIKEDELENIWDKYYKIDKSHKRDVVGTGLGLSIVKNILERHNFIYGATSNESDGTIFYFVVPKEKKK